jgi:hypothetical protein
MFNHSNFLVHPPDSLIKSYGIVDLDMLVDFLMNHPEGSQMDLQTLEQELSDPNSALHHSLDPDFNDTGLNPYEEDAIHMAILKGKITKEEARILNNPDLQNYPGIAQIRKKALGEGAKLVNEAARIQNQMNGTNEPLPFTEGGELRMEYRNAVAGKIYDQTKANSTHFNPRNSQGKLVTRLISTKQHSGGREESYARWYGPAARELGFLPTKKGKGKIDDLSIPAHYVHKNTINLNDRGIFRDVFNTIKSNTNPAEAVEDVRNLKSMFHHMNPIHHSDNASMHEYNDRQAERQAMVDAGQGSPDGEMLVDGKEISVEGSPTRPNHEDIIHPKVYEEIPAFRLFMERGRGGGSYHYPSKKLKNSLKEHMGLDEETVERVFALSRKSNKNRVHGNAWHNVAHEINQAMQQQTPTDIPLEPTPETGIKKPVIPPQIKVSSNAPRINPKPDAERIVNVGNQPRINRLPAELIDQINRRKFELGINSNEPLSDTGYRDRRAAVMNPESLSRLFTSLTNGLNIEELEKSMFEDYLEGVQMRLAETVLADYTDIRKMDISSPTDITILSSRIQRSTNDVITIYHTRGDWRNIAKSFGLDPLDVQLVKVSLNG